MTKFTFICEDDPFPFCEKVMSKKTVEFSAESLRNVIEEFELFLKAAGFHFNGKLDFVNDE